MLDEIYSEFGYFAEKSGSLVFEGAEGANKITSLMKSYADEPVREILHSKVTNIRNFETDQIKDVEGDLIPKTKMLMLELEDGTRIAVRPSGTEPVIRVMAEGDDASEVEQVVDAICAAVKEAAA